MTRFLPDWRKATWALAIFSALMGIWVVTAIPAGIAVGGGIAITFIVLLWFVGFIVLGFAWLMSRSQVMVVILGPNGQQVTVSEKEAKRRVSTEVGWSYQAHAS